MTCWLSGRKNWPTPTSHRPPKPASPRHCGGAFFHGVAYVSDAICTISKVVKNYGPFRALHGIDLTVMPGEFIALVGPSGSGKSTLLQIISGFEHPTEGTLEIDGVDMTDVTPAKRPTSMVFQKLALFPHKTVADNIGFPLKLRKVQKSEIEARTREMLDLMDLKLEYLSRYPSQLSGGEQQRVALARSMISHPKLLLLDEPLSALDVKLKKVLQAELKRLHRSLGVTFIHVTHDLEEAMILADRICVMKDGRLLQTGSPDDIYYRPTHPFVAEFIGATNLFPIKVTNAGGESVSFVGDGFVSGVCPAIAPIGTDGLGYLMVRPEFIQIANGNNQLDVTVPVVVNETFNRGSTTLIKTVSGDQRHEITLEFQGHLDPAIAPGVSLHVGWNNSKSHILARDRAIAA